MEGRVIIFKVYRKGNQRVVNRFCQKFYGQDTTSHGGKYRHHKQGLLEDIPHVKLLRGVIIVAENDWNAVVEFLKKFNAEIYVRRVVLTPGDKKALGKG
jgi:hypothetical protein